MDELRQLESDLLRTRARLFALETLVALLLRGAAREPSARQTIASELQKWESKPLNLEFPEHSQEMAEALTDEVQAAFQNLIALFKDTILKD